MVNTPGLSMTGLYFYKMVFTDRGFFLALLAGALFILQGCKGGSDRSAESSTEKSPTISRPAFNPDSAYRYIATQVALGPRTPGSKAQTQCAAWMLQNFRQYADTVYKQTTQVKGGDGKMLPCINLVASIHPAAVKRILLLAHWDSRPWTDMDPADKTAAVPGADDGASGVAVLLELARQIKSKPLPADLGIDMLLTDVEDYGRSDWGEQSYALGTQYWAGHPHVAGYKADFGILLDMVGARNAQFPLEASSTRYAGAIQQKVWQAANDAGYSSYFPFIAGPEITDDHVFVNKIANIPTIDIININSNSQSVFAPHWHTRADNMDVIDRNTLKAVGETLLQLIYGMTQSG